MKAREVLAILFTLALQNLFPYLANAVRGPSHRTCQLQEINSIPYYQEPPKLSNGIFYSEDFKNYQDMGRAVSIGFWANPAWQLNWSEITRRACLIWRTK